VPTTKALKHLLEQAAHNERTLRRYQELELELLAAGSFAGLVEVLLELAPAHFRLDGTELWLLDRERELRGLLGDGLQQPGLSWLEDPGPLQELYGERPRVELRSIDQGDPLGAIFPGRRLRSVALVPLVRRDRLIGSLHLGAFAGRRFTRGQATDFMTHLGEVVGLCLENALAQERLRYLSRVDTLTGLHNRRAFEAVVEQELARARREDQPLALLFVKLGGLEQINEDHGAATGDRLLVAVARELVGMLRRADHLCRDRGAGFALLLPGCSRARAMEVAERIRQQLAEVRAISSTGIPVAASAFIGATAWSGEGEAARTLLARGVAAAAAARAGGSRRTGHSASS